MKNPVQVVRSGEEAVAYLRGQRKFSNRAEYPLPALVLLDLKLPGMNGFEVLTWIRQHYRIRGLPVVVLTTSDQMRDVNRAYQLGAYSFSVKELDLDGTWNFGKLLEEYWLRWVRMPETFRPEEETSKPEENRSGCR